MKILITGATGFLGSHLCQRLVREGHQVTAFTRPNSNMSELEGLEIKRALGDITDIDSVNRALENQYLVIHTAAHLAYWGQTKHLQTKVNLEGTRNLVLACIQQQVKKLIHISSVAAVGIPLDPRQPADENFVFNLQQSGLNYHISKWKAETEVLQHKSSTLETIVINPGTIFGPFGQRFRGGEMIDKVVRSPVVPYFLGGINVVHVDDVVEGICTAIEKGKNGERYILGGENITFRQLVEVVAESLGLQRLFVPVPPLATALLATASEPIAILSKKRPRFTREVHYCAHRFHFYDYAKASRELGYNPRSFRHIVAEYWNFKKVAAV